MKNKKKLVFFPLLSTGTLISATALMASGCGPKTVANYEELVKEIQKDPFNLKKEMNGSYVTKGKEFTSVGNANSKIRVSRQTMNSAYKQADVLNYENSQSYGQLLKKPFDNAIGQLISVHNMFSPIVEEKNSKGTRTYTIKRPSVWRYRLELAEKVVVTLNDGTVKVFDTDDFDETSDNYLSSNVEFPTAEADGTFKNQSYKLVSKNAKSINSNEFTSALKDAKKLQLTLKKEAKWINAKGELTNYSIVPSDFYVSWLRTNLLPQEVRESELQKAAGASAKLEDYDKLMRDILPGENKMFTESRTYPNRYLYDVYGIDAAKLDEENTFVQTSAETGSSDKAVTFEKQTSKTNALFEELFKNLTEDYTFTPAPSQYIAEHIATPQLESFVNGQSAQPIINKIKSFNTTSKLAKSGVYWYGYTPKYFLWAGKYYYNGYNSVNGEEEWTKNEHYVDKHFVNNKNTISKHFIKYMNSTDEKRFNENIYKLYKDGEVYGMSYSTLSESQKTDFNNGRVELGAFYAKELEKSRSMFETFWRLMPGPASGKYAKDLHYNEHFAKLFYGAKLDDVKSGNLKLADYKNMLDPKTVSFRTLINGAINWEFLASQLNNSTAKTWINGLAPHGDINGSDHATSKFKNANDDYQNINSLYILDSNGNKAQFTYKDNATDKEITTTEISPAANYAAYINQGDNKTKIRSAAFDKIKELMKKLLDDYYQQNNLDNTVKVKLNYVFRWANWKPELYENFYKELLPNLFKDLDPRLEFSYIKFNSSQGEQLFDALLTTGESATMAVGWGYDINQIGSGIDGMSTSGLDLLLILIANNTDVQDKLKGSYPEIVKAAVAFKEFSKGTSYKLSFDFDKFNKLTSRQLFNMRNLYSRVKIKTENGDSVELEKAGATDNFTDMAALTSQFFTSYASKMTNEQNLAFAKEVSNFVGPQLDTLRWISKNEFKVNLYNPHYRVPFCENDFLLLADINIWD